MPVCLQNTWAVDWKLPPIWNIKLTELAIWIWWTENSIILGIGICWKHLFSNVNELCTCISGIYKLWMGLTVVYLTLIKIAVLTVDT